MSTLQLEAQWEGTRSIACQWGPAWLYEAPAESPQPKESSAVTAELAAINLPSVDASLIACQTDDGGDNPLTALAAFAAYSESCWAELLTDDYCFLTGPRRYPSRCPWCGGRLVHNRRCDDLRSDWEPKMPFGKHKGRRVSEVPKDYLRWLIAHCARFEPDLRQAIEDRLKSRLPSGSTCLNRIPARKTPS